MELNCKKCKYSWDYNGQSKYYATCPRCRNTNIKVIKKIIPSKNSNDPEWATKDLSNSIETDKEVEK